MKDVSSVAFLFMPVVLLVGFLGSLFIKKVNKKMFEKETYKYNVKRQGFTITYEDSLNSTASLCLYDYGHVYDPTEPKWGYEVEADAVAKIRKCFHQGFFEVSGKFVAAGRVINVVIHEKEDYYVDEKDRPVEGI